MTQAERIARLEEKVNQLEEEADSIADLNKTMNQAKGAWKLVLAMVTLLGIALTIIK